MTISHHPSDETLARFAAGTLEAGPALVVAAHLDACPVCRQAVSGFEAVGGALLAELAPTEMSEDALARMLARIEAPEPPPAPRPRGAAPNLPGNAELPASLQACGIGRWRWLAPGMRWSRVSLPRATQANVMLLRIGPNKRLLEHGHAGTEYTQVISGSFSDVRGRYLPGDLMEADAEIDHQPAVDADGECICLIAVEGQLRPRSLIGRLFQPLLGF